MPIQFVFGDNLRVLPEEMNGIKTENMMHVYLEKHAKVCIERWKQEFESLETEELRYSFHRVLFAHQILSRKHP